MAVQLLEAIQAFGLTFLDVVPSLVVSLVLLAIGYVLGRVLGRVANEVVTRLKLDTRVSKSAHLRLKLAHLADVLVRWVIYLVFIQQASDTLGSAAISGFIGDIIAALPSFIGAGVIVLVSYVIGVFFKDHIVASHTVYSDLAGKTIFFLTLYLGLSVALRVIEIPLLIVDQILIILVAAVGLGLALAIGLGLKDVVRDVSKGYVATHSKRK